MTAVGHQPSFYLEIPGRPLPRAYQPVSDFPGDRLDPAKSSPLAREIERDADSNENEIQAKPN